METKPCTFQRGVPAEEANAFFGSEDELIAMAPGDIEVLRGAAAEKAIVLRNAAYKSRTGQDALAIVDGDDD